MIKSDSGAMEPIVLTRTLLHQVVGVLLLFSALLFLLIMLVQIPELPLQNEQAFRSNDTAWWYISGMATNTLYIFSRMALGYVIFLRKRVAHLLFFSLCLLTLISGGMGFVLAIAALMVRFWPDNDIKNSNAD